MAISPESGLPIAVPQDVLQLILRIFAGCNDEVSGTLARIPMTREDALDQMLISFLDRQGPQAAPTSGWVVDVETHFLGGGHHYGTWEIADIGVLLVLRRGHHVCWSKVAILQSKRLFPLGATHDESAERARFRWGFGRLHELYEPLAATRTFETTEQSRYESLDVSGAQSERIEVYQGEFTVPVHYLLYNPVAIPWTRSVPGSPAALPQNTVGCRVVRAQQVRSLRNNAITKPSYADIASLAAPSPHAPFHAGWRLEDFIVTLLLGCHEGKVLTASLDNAMELLFYRRTGPIAAAFAVNIEMVG